MLARPAAPSAARLAAACLALGGALVACDAGEDGPARVELAVASLAPCTGAGNADGGFPAGADKVVVRVTGGAIPEGEPILRAFTAADAAGGTAEVADIPAGSGLTLDAVACDEGVATWEGYHTGLEVKAGEDTPVTLFLTPVGEVACVGLGASGTNAPASSAHGFAATAAGADGAWLLGGFGSYAASQARLGATTRVDRYDRLRSEWALAGELGAPRAMALAQRLQDGRVRLVGGTADLTLSPSGVPLRVGAGSAPADGVEIWDPSTGQSSGGPGVAFAALPAVAALGDGRAVAVGGVGADGKASAQAWIVSGGTPTEVALPEGRYGAAVAAAGSAGVLVWGGRDDATDGLGVWIDAATGNATALTGTTAAPMTLFASAAWVGTSDGRHTFLVVGGTEVQDSGGEIKALAKVERASPFLVTVDPATWSFTAAPVPLGEEEPLFRRAGARLLALEGGELWLVGGFTSWTQDAEVCPGAASACLQAVAPRLRVDGGAVSVLEPRLELSVGSFGASPVALADGAWLVAGGLPDVSSGSVVDAHAALVRHRARRADLCSVEPIAAP